MGCPIRKFTDQSLFAAPHDLSQRTTSFIASQHQGIHRIPLRHLIALIINTHRAPSKAERNPSAEARSRSAAVLVQGVGDHRVIDFLKTSLLQTYPRALRSSKSPLTEDADAGRPIGPSTGPKTREKPNSCAPTKSDMFSLHNVGNPAPRSKARGETLDVSPDGKQARPSRGTLIIGQSRSRSINRKTQPQMVEPDGIEPTTSCLQSTRSPS